MAQVIIIEAKKEGFRRCGVSHGIKPVEYPLTYFTKEQLAILQAEPMLVVKILEKDMAKLAEEAEDTDKAPKTTKRVTK